MEKEFVPYELALKLKNLGFDELCFGYYTHNEKLCRYDSTSTNVEFTPCIHKNIYNLYCLAPLWQQAFDWFREKYNIDYSVIPFYYQDEAKIKFRWDCYNFIHSDIPNKRRFESFGNGEKTHQEARKACLEKLIEIVENENRS